MVLERTNDLPSISQLEHQDSDQGNSHSAQGQAALTKH